MCSGYLLTKCSFLIIESLEEDATRFAHGRCWRCDRLDRFARGKTFTDFSYSGQEPPDIPWYSSRNPQHSDIEMKAKRDCDTIQIDFWHIGFNGQSNVTWKKLFHRSFKVRSVPSIRVLIVNKKTYYSRQWLHLTFSLLIIKTHTHL